MSKTENKWRDSSLRPFLESIDGCAFFIKEAKTIRGLPDLIGVLKGVPFYLEIKKNDKELHSPRTVLQEYQLKKFKKSGAFTSFIYPENAQEVLLDLLSECLLRDRINYDEFKSYRKLLLQSFPNSVNDSSK